MKDLIVQENRSVAKKAQEDKALRSIEAARINLGKALTVQDIKKVGDGAESLQVYAMRQKLSKEVLDEATALLIDSRSKLGESLSKLSPDKKSGFGRDPSYPTLPELGITYEESRESQFLFRLLTHFPDKFSRVRRGDTTVRRMQIELRGTDKWCHLVEGNGKKKTRPYYSKVSVIPRMTRIKGVIWIEILFNDKPVFMFRNERDGMDFSRELQKFGRVSIASNGFQLKIVPLDKKTRSK